MKIGITGGIASGKSLISNMIRKRGYVVIDADEIAKQIVMKGNIAYSQIVKEFGQEILDDNCEIDRKLLGKKIFGNKCLRIKLNNITHPIIEKVMMDKVKEIEKYKGIVFLDIPLLFEVGHDKLVDKIIVVTVSDEIQLQRLMDRDKIDISFAKQKVSSQMSLQNKKMLADYVIDNSGSVEMTEKQLDNVLIQLQL
jgi:dephospho-CoA kinase